MNIPIMYIWLYRRIKEKNRTSIVKTSFLKEIISRSHPLPRCFIYDIIKDMEKLGLLNRIDHTKYQILKNNCEKKINKFIW